MTRMAQAGTDAWSKKADEIIEFGKPWPKEKRDAYNKEHPLPSEEELDAIYDRYNND